MIITSKFHYDQPDLIPLLYREASKDQTRTAIRLGTAYASVYQPAYLLRDDFEGVRKALVRHCRAVMQNDRLWISRDVWGLTYDNGEGTAPHVHKGVPFSVIWYLEADDGCGSLEFFGPNGDDRTFQPEAGMCIIFDGRLPHGVLPSVVPTARRSCIVGNLYDLDTMRAHHPKGYYVVDEEFK